MIDMVNIIPMGSHLGPYGCTFLPRRQIVRRERLNPLAEYVYLVNHP